MKEFSFVTSRIGKTTPACFGLFPMKLISARTTEDSGRTRGLYVPFSASGSQCHHLHKSMDTTGKNMICCFCFVKKNSY